MVLANRTCRDHVDASTRLLIHHSLLDHRSRPIDNPLRPVNWSLSVNNALPDHRSLPVHHSGLAHDRSLPNDDTLLDHRGRTVDDALPNDRGTLDNDALVDNRGFLNDNLLAHDAPRTIPTLIPPVIIVSNLRLGRSHARKSKKASASNKYQLLHLRLSE
jgi:hypothetical protein